MTLRHRLLLVYSIVVLLTVATVGVAVFELRQARQILADVHHWYGIVQDVQDLRDRLPASTEDSDTAAEAFQRTLTGQAFTLTQVGDYIDIDRVREALFDVFKANREWQNAQSLDRTASPAPVRESLDHLAQVVDQEVEKLNDKAKRQDERTRVFLFVVVTLTAMHVAVIGWLLRRWLLRPMEQLNNQVEALARDEPPGEPLLTAPLEMARLAQAMDRARQSLGDMRERLLQTERLTTIGQFAAQLAHNLRNPLASIRAAAQISARRAARDPGDTELMNDIIASVDRLNRWIEGLMEVARRQPTPLKSEDVLPVVYRARDGLVGELTAKELRVELDVPSSPVICPHDPATLEHALVAILTNAVEASPLGAPIHIVVETLKIQGIFQCRIRVMDEGAGLPADQPGRIFDFAYTTKQRGMGLGLALAREALERQGGSVGAVNRPEGGASVYIDLPCEPWDDASADLTKLPPRVLAPVDS